MSLQIPETNSLGWSKEQVEEGIYRLYNSVNLFGGKKGINGHFWVERNDEKIDTWWREYDEKIQFVNSSYIKKKLITNKNLIYVECSNPLTNKLIFAKLNKAVSSITGDYETSLQLLCECYDKPIHNMCLFNALIESTKNGGKMKFGSLGIKTDDNRITFWFSGNSKFSTFNDYIKDSEEFWTEN